MTTPRFFLIAALLAAPTAGHAAKKAANKTAAKVITMSVARQQVKAEIARVFKTPANEIRSIKFTLAGAGVKRFVATGPNLAWAGGLPLKFGGTIRMTAGKGKRITGLQQLRLQPINLAL